MSSRPRSSASSSSTVFLPASAAIATLVVAGGAVWISRGDKVAHAEMLVPDLVPKANKGKGKGGDAPVEPDRQIVGPRRHDELETFSWGSNV